MKPIYYDSLPRFTNRIIKQWTKQGFKYNSGNVQLLRFAWIAKVYWANKKALKMAKTNKIDINQLNLY